MTKKAGSGSESGSNSQRHGSADPDPPQNVMDPQHWKKQTVIPASEPIVSHAECVFLSGFRGGCAAQGNVSWIRIQSAYDTCVRESRHVVASTTAHLQPRVL
jgi:hypothetical protein